MAWNLKGCMSLREYFELTGFERAVLCHELNERCTQHNDALSDDD